ncbi:MAG: hypothetical protein LC131_09615 [Anaerolineae bacterium]|nr:hypothetical protein [Promineifilum sp.]MCZ2114077.1 hypothetical protein [Anaerolineae bacterium]HNS39689.1 hypothetical protein [Promineifilum sp.]
MRVIMDRDLCDASLPYCSRCSAAFIRYPEGVDRHCIREVIDDGSDLLTIEMKTDGREFVIELSDEERELASVEGWEALADFDPALFRTGAMERWRELSKLPVN